MIFSVEPIHACAPPIRPPRRRNSSVSTAKRIFMLLAELAGAGGGLRERRRRPGPRWRRDRHQAVAGADGCRSRPPRSARARRRARAAGRAPARPSGRCPRCRPTGGSRGCRRPARSAARRPRGSRRPTAATWSAARARMRRCVVEGVEVRQVGLAVVARRVAPAHVQRDGVEPVPLGELARHVVGRVGRRWRPGMARHPNSRSDPRCDDPPRMGATLVTGATGSWARMSPARSWSAATTCG